MKRMLLVLAAALVAGMPAAAQDGFEGNFTLDPPGDGGDAAPRGDGGDDGDREGGGTPYGLTMFLVALAVIAVVVALVLAARRDR